MSETSKQSIDEKVTAVEKSDNVKAKDPRKVELGKKLAKISKERKARHHEALREKSEADRDNQSLAEEINRIVDLSGYVDFIPFRYIVGGVTIVAVLGGLYYAYRQDKRLEHSESERSNRERFEWSESEQNELNKNASGLSEKVKTINKNYFEITKCKPPHLAASTKCSIENLWKFYKKILQKIFYMYK